MMEAQTNAAGKYDNISKAGKRDENAAQGAEADEFGKEGKYASDINHF